MEGGMAGSTAFRRMRAAVTTVTALSFAVALLPLHVVTSTGAVAQTVPRAGLASSSGIMSRAEYEACQARDDAGFRTAIEGLTFKGLQTGLKGVDYRAVVNEEWRKLNVDDIIDKQVDVAVGEVRDETSWTNLIRSIASEEQAKALASTVAERVYRSEALKGAIENLAGGVGRALGKRIELATADTAEPAMQCMQAFLGPRYGRTVAGAFSRDAGKEYQIDPSRAGAEVTTGNVLAEGASGITGAIILLVRRQLANMASRIGSRIVGTVMSRVVGAVAGGVGLVLIAKDIWEFRNGVLPIVSTEMKSRATKDKVQEELARAIEEQLTENVREISARTADRVVDIWHEFKRAHAKVLALADTNPSFKAFLESLKPEALGRLDEVVALVSAKDGDAGVLRRLDNGTLNEAVNRMPLAGLDIARDTRSLDDALQWWALAGDGLERLLEAEIHKRAKPDTFTKAGLQRVLAISDRSTMQRLASLAPASRDVLLDLDAGDLKTLGRALSETELTSLSGYMTALEKGSATRILRAVAQTPSKMQVLARTSVRSAILASRDQSLAVSMMLRSDAVPDPFVAIEHARYVMDGKVSPILLWEKHPAFVGAALLIALILMAMLKRLLFGRRPNVIVQRVEAPAAKRASNAPPIRTADKS
jgi:nitrogen regulatory protein PII-like uncharacterized protein